MKTITREELRARFDTGKPVQLVMALGKWAYDQMHIPGSVPFDTRAVADGRLKRDQEVILYCTNQACPAGYRTYYQLKSLGYTKITCYVEGIEDWAAAGLPLEGRMVGMPA